MFSALWSRFGRVRTVRALSLGDLEKDVLERLWGSGPCAVRDLHSAYGGTLAYTTLMTTLDRLHKKGLLNRCKEGKAFIYSPAFTREELDRSVVHELVGALVRDRGAHPSPVISCFVDAIGEEDEQLLAALEDEIKRRRAASKSRME